jgi:Flp pilus assembly pilin Flp
VAESGAAGNSRTKRSFPRGEEGASLVEFALILPIVVLLLFGLIDFGLVFGSYITLHNGVNAGAREASVDDYNLFNGTCKGGPDPVTADMVCTVIARIGSLQAVSATSLNIGIAFPGGTPAAVGQNVEICAQGSLKSVTGLTGFALNGKKMTSTSTVRLEQAPAFSTYSSGQAAVTFTPTGSSSITVSALGTGTTCP